MGGMQALPGKGTGCWDLVFRVHLAPREDDGWVLIDF